MWPKSMKKPMSLPAAIHWAVIFVNTAGEIVNHDVTEHVIYSVLFVLRHHDMLNYLNDLLKTNIFTKLMIWYWLFSLISSHKIFFNKKDNVKSSSCASTGRHWKYTKYISFLWPPVLAAHDRKRLVGALRSSRRVIVSRKTTLFPGFINVHQIPPISSHCTLDSFLIKSPFLWKSVRLKGIPLCKLEYIDHRLFFPISRSMQHLITLLL